jgi:hypothetical protein
MPESDCSSSSTSSSSSSDFNTTDLLDIIGILLLPLESLADLDIVKFKDADITDLLEQLYEHFEFENEHVKVGFAKIVQFVNNNRKECNKRRINVKNIENEQFREIVTEGLKILL